MKRFMLFATLAACLLMTTGGCAFFTGDETASKPRMSMFVGVDISGSFMNSGYFEDSIDFLAHYLYNHLNGVGGAEVPAALFVSSIGGAREGEPKTFYPIQTFENKSVEEIATTLRSIFPREEINPFTDYNAFFEQVALTVKNKNLVLRPITVVMASDGIPDVSRGGETDYESIVLRPLERLARSVTVRLLYTNAVVGKNWQTRVKRQRVKIWTQDAEVMVSWRDPKILDPGRAMDDQPQFYAWLGDNVDFGVRSRRVN